MADAEPQPPESVPDVVSDRIAHDRPTIIPLVIATVVAAAFVALVPAPYGCGVAAVAIWIGCGAIPGVIAGKDGAWSTSKFQLFLWTGTVAYCLVTTAALCRLLGPLGVPPAVLPLPELKPWMMVALGLSASTTLAAKGIVVGYLGAGRLQESKAGDVPPPGWLALIGDDRGVPEISKMQMLFWTMAACAYVIVEQTLMVHDALLPGAAIAPSAGLPDIPTGLVVLTGLGQGAYLGDKLFDAELPRMSGVERSVAKPGEKVRVMGSQFGARFEGQRVELDGMGIEVEPAMWSDSAFVCVIPLLRAGKPWPPEGTTVSIRVFVREVISVNETRIAVVP